jgi:hypothetical protein
MKNYYVNLRDPRCFEAFLNLKAIELDKNDFIVVKENRLSFQKIYRKSQISFFFFEKIAIEVDRFLQKSLKKS